MGEVLKEMRKRESWERGRCESGGADGVRPPLPICAEGGGGTRLLGRRGHSRAQRVGPTLPGSAASLSSTSSPRCLWREKGGAVGRGGERKRRDVVSGGNSKGGVSGPPLPLQPPRPGETQEERNHSHPIPPPASATTVHTTALTRRASDAHTHSCTHPTPHIITDPATADACAACSSRTHQILTCAQGTTPIPTPRRGVQAHMHTHTTGHMHACTCYTFTEVQEHTRPSRGRSVHSTPTPSAI